MKTLIVLLAALGIAYVGWTLWRWAHDRKHDPVEYFAGWDGYTLPIRLTDQITKQQAEANPKGVVTTREYQDGAVAGFFW
jgi:hypothetical protein